MKRTAVLACLLLMPLAVVPAGAAVLQVGPGRPYATVQAAYNAASSGDTIEIDSGIYFQAAGWVYVNGKHNLTFRGVGPTRPVLDAGNACLRSKGIFVIEVGTTNTTIENLELCNARLYPTGANGAGVRAQGTHLTLRNCYIHDCDDGVLNGSGNVLFEYCEFDHNGYGDGQSHNMYIAYADSFTLAHCYVHRAVIGHEVKTRSKNTYILYNRICNEDGSASYEVQPANGGNAYIIGNLIQQGPSGDNGGIISYATEGFQPGYGTNLYVVNNTIVNDRGSGTIVAIATGTTALLENNVIIPGTAALWSGSGTKTEITNWITSNPALADRANFNYRLTPASIGAINQGTPPGIGIDGFAMTPLFQYVHPASRQDRPADAQIDIGAYEHRAADLDTDGDIDLDDVNVLLSNLTGPVPTYTFEDRAGLIVFEAEHATQTTAGSGSAAGWAWSIASGGGSTGDGFVRAVPDTGLQIADPVIESDAPRLRFAIRPGSTMYRIWLRARAPDVGGDTVHFGLDNMATSTSPADAIVVPPGPDFIWSSLRANGGSPWVIPGSIDRSFCLWLSEDGVEIDRIVLAADGAYVPDNPPQSPGYLTGDLDGDHDVDLADFRILAALFE